MTALNLLPHSRQGVEAGGRPTLPVVVRGGGCIGCGACSVATEGRIQVARDEFGMPQADLSGVGEADLAAGSRVCPFADESADASAVAEGLYAGAPHSSPQIGAWTGLYAGRLTDTDRLLGSSSGGLTTWVLEQLLLGDQVDGVIHVGASAADDELFGFAVSTTREELLARRKSIYSMSSFDEAVRHVESTPGRYAFVGVPCHVRAMRLLARQRPVLAQRVLYHVGLVCGHGKTPGFASSLAWQLGVQPAQLAGVDFRVKDPTRTVGDYSFAATDGSGWVQARVGALLGAQWGHTMFQPAVCEFCDDIYAETADICFGDAWLPAYKDEWRGTNVVVVRSGPLQELLLAGARRGEIDLEELSERDMVASQGGNFRHRRVGLAIRVADDERAGRWVPPTRVVGDRSAAPWHRRQLIRQRRVLARESVRALSVARKRDDLAFYLRRMSTLVRRYDALDVQGTVRRVGGRARALLHVLQR